MLITEPTTHPDQVAQWMRRTNIRAENRLHIVRMESLEDQRMSELLGESELSLLHCATVVLKEPSISEAVGETDAHVVGNGTGSETQSAEHRVYRRVDRESHGRLCGVGGLIAQANDRADAVCTDLGVSIRRCGRR